MIDTVDLHIISGRPQGNYNERHHARSLVFLCLSLSLPITHSNHAHVTQREVSRAAKLAGSMKAIEKTRLQAHIFL